MSRASLLALAGLFSAPVFATGSLAEISIIDRDSGQVLPTHYHQGEYWVAGRPGAHYAIRINSRDGRRLLAVTAVDGVNVLTGETAAHGQIGYVFDPWQGYEVAGWRKSDSQIAAFTFTSIPKSYAARTGRPQNVGVIGVALFTEMPRAPKIARESLPSPPPPATQSAGDELEEVQVTGSRVTGRGESHAESADRARAAPAAPSLGTGHGRREHSVITRVQFVRASDTPDEVIRIRYDSRANLVAMGVIHAPRPHTPDPFPNSPQPGYVPDP